MAEWAKSSLTVLQDEDNAWWKPSAGQGRVVGLRSYLKPGGAKEPRLLVRLRQRIEATASVERRTSLALGGRAAPDLALGAANWTRWGAVGVEARRLALGYAEDEYDL